MSYPFRGEVCTILRSASISKIEFSGFVCWAKKGWRSDETKPYEIHLTERNETVAIICYDKLDEAFKFWSDFLSGLCAEVAAGTVSTER